ncbi:hypothetical protein [Spongiactinospora sp. TRM90649]|uniref:hypothetical protein n=1 Tax=Spongiactinospora sp. TRM90649 TaxID=3031114 RepID=UPI0023F8E417|nr:hypothetical protein [Spongiactinospora sp. TRM90649]MDF5754109.1 hypothetical protein [Spongiactinospora sp. TRM90649]
MDEIHSASGSPPQEPPAPPQEPQQSHVPATGQDDEREATRAVHAGSQPLAAPPAGPPTGPQPFAGPPTGPRPRTAPPVGPPADPPPPGAPPGAPPQAGAAGYQPPLPPPGGPPLRNATRYLCAGAYLDQRFRDRVLRELLDDRHRAVAPSYGGVDLIPVLSHCLRAERLTVLRDVFVTLLLMLCLFVPPAILIVLTLLPLALWTLPGLRQGGVLTKAVLWGLTAAAVMFVVLPLFAADLFAGEYDLLTGEYTSGTLRLGTMAIPILIAALPFVVALGYRVMWYLTLSERLKPGAHDSAPDDTTPHDDRLQYINRAQWGNITLYGDENPFVGAGHIRRSWSIAVELDRKQPTGADLRRPRAPRRREQVEIDSVDLHDFVRDRLHQMRDAVGDPAQRVEGLHITDHLAVRGTFTRRDWPDARARDWNTPAHSHPLIDSDTGMPHYEAPKDTIDAVTRHPQGGVRHYQRVTVNVEGQEIRSAHDLLLSPAEDREIVVSAFIHLAVEGRMLYTQLVVTLLPPVRADFHVIDMLPSLPRPIVVWRAAKASPYDLVADVLFGPARLVSTVCRNAVRGIRQRNPARYLVYPFGARESVREMGAAPRVDRFMQVLDADKYTKLIEQRLTEAVLDYLEARDIDTAGFRDQATMLINNGAIISGGNVSGPVAAGSHASARQHQHGQAQQGGGGK